LTTIISLICLNKSSKANTRLTLWNVYVKPAKKCTVKLFKKEIR